MTHLCYDMCLDLPDVLQEEHALGGRRAEGVERLHRHGIRGREVVDEAALGGVLGAEGDADQGALEGRR